MHRREFREARALIAEAAAYLAEAESALGAHADVRYAGFLNDAKKEFAEANLTLAFVEDNPCPPPPSSASTCSRTSTGWRKRRASCAARCSTASGATRAPKPSGCSALMDEVYGMLVTVDYPDALTGGLRRSTDALRAVLERTRGDVTTAIVAARLQAAIEGRSSQGPTGF